MDALIVDDSSFMRKVLTNILDPIGFDTVYEAENGTEAIDLFEEHHPDLVLLDIVMKGMDGIEALKAMKDTGTETKIIMISAVGQEHMVEQAQEAGADDFITKPFENEEVKATVEDVIEA